MANATLKREEGKTPYAQGMYTTSQNSTNDEEILDSFQSLEVDEARLSEQKEHLTILLNQLEIKAKEEFEKRKQRVERLNSEVSDLKRRCEKFAGWVSSESTLES
jgi:hypothetical protein